VHCQCTAHVEKQGNVKRKSVTACQTISQHHPTNQYDDAGQGFSKQLWLIPTTSKEINIDRMKGA